MIVVSGLVPFRAETRERLHQACVEMAAKSALEPGCLTYEFSGVLGTENTLRLFEEWEDDGSLTRHFGVEGFASFSAILRECLSEAPATNAPQTTLRSNETPTSARHAAMRDFGEFSARRPSPIFAARSHRKSPEKAMWLQPTGDVWASISSGTSSPAARRCATASAM
jgi:quinol monooxygenase YgiN